MFRLVLFPLLWVFVVGECPPYSMNLDDDPAICYSFHPEYTKFAIAQRHCQSFGADLVSIKNDYINTFVSRKFLSNVRVSGTGIPDSVCQNPGAEFSFRISLVPDTFF